MSAANAAIAGIGLFAVTLFSHIRARNETQPVKDKALRKRLSEKQIDKMIADSFPASDPPSTY